jgi:hypothetical protein
LGRADAIQSLNQAKLIAASRHIGTWVQSHCSSHP